MNGACEADALPYRRVIAAVLLRAVRDAERGDRDAAAWLVSADAHALADALGLECWPPNLNN